MTDNMIETPEAHARDPREAFAHVDTWVFDLDNTLYPANSAIFPQIHTRITDYVAEALGLEREEARTVQTDYYKKYGTSLRGLMTEHGVSPDEFLAYVHDIDHSPLEPNPELGAAIDALPGRKLVLTNGTRLHAENILDRLGIADHFEGKFGIIEAGFTPKPERENYDIFMRLHDVDASRSAFFEDLAVNLVVPHQLDMVTTLVVPPGTREVLHGEWEMEGQGSDPNVDFVTEDLTAFLRSAR
ncbi:MAG: pyrimidine 5'-nucleotidase [Pseudomonadota bacterium]